MGVRLDQIGARGWRWSEADVRGSPASCEVPAQEGTRTAPSLSRVFVSLERPGLSSMKANRDESLGGGGKSRPSVEEGTEFMGVEGTPPQPCSRARVGQRTTKVHVLLAYPGPAPRLL